MTKANGSDIPAKAADKPAKTLLQKIIGGISFTAAFVAAKAFTQ